MLHPRRSAEAAVETVSRWARPREVALLGLCAEHPERYGIELVAPDELAARCELLISLGGDGSWPDLVGVARFEPAAPRSQSDQPVARSAVRLTRRWAQRDPAWSLFEPRITPGTAGFWPEAEVGR